MSTHMLTVSAVDLLLRVSAASVGAGEYPANTNSGPYVEPLLASTGTPKGKPWCASQVSRWGHLALGDDWPCPNTASVMQICEWAEQQGVRYIPALTSKGRPRIGDIYALWSKKLQRWAHLGLIIGVHDGLEVTVRDGNTSSPKDTNPETQREGWLCAEKRRTLTKDDRIIRWVDALTV
jgi:hypothetical protein